MKKTTVQYFCDRCGEEISDISQTETVLTGWDSYGLQNSHVNVSIQYTHTGVVDYKTSMLCNKCKIEALEEVLKKLKKRSERNG